MTPDTETETEPTLEDSLREAFSAAQQEPEPSEAPLPETAEPESERAARERDESGRFKTKEAAAEPAPEPEATPAEQPEPEVKPDPYGLVPQYAGPAIKGAWKDLPPSVREEITKRDREVHQTFTRFDEERNFGRQVKDVVKPYEGLIKSLGAEPTQAIDYLLKTDYVLRTAQPAQRVEMFRKAAADYGIDLSALAGGQTQPATPANPALETALQRIERLERELNGATTARRETEQAQIDQSIAAFASDPENVYYEQVMPAMAALLQGGQARDLKEAYDKAVWANPETRALHLAAMREAEDRKRTEQATAQVSRARQASPSVTGAPGSAVPASHMNGSASNSVEDDVRLAISAVAGRA